MTTQPKTIRRTLLAATLSSTALVGLAGGALAQDEACTERLGRHDPVIMVTASPTGTWFPTGVALAEMANQNYEGQPVAVQPGSGAIGNIMSVGTNRADMGLSYGPFLLAAQEGNNDINPGEAMPDLRAVMSLATNALHVLKADDAPFASFEELVAEKPEVWFATGVPGASENFALGKLLEFYESSYDDVKSWGGNVIWGTVAERTEDWANGKLDLYAAMFEPPHPQIIRLMENTAGEVMTLPEDVRNYFMDEFGYESFTIPAGSYPGQEADVETIGVPYSLFTRADVSEELIYNMVKCMAQTPERLHQVSARYERQWTPEVMPNGVGIELHEGAKRYYRERGWIE